MLGSGAQLTPAPREASDPTHPFDSLNWLSIRGTRKAPQAEGGRNFRIPPPPKREDATPSTALPRSQAAWQVRAHAR